MGANGDGGADVDMLGFEAVEEGRRDVGTGAAVLGFLDVVVLAVAAGGPRVRVNCVTGIAVVGTSSVFYRFCDFFEIEKREFD